jgi:hypothetical protein
MGLTIAFEFGFGLLTGNSPAVLLTDYNLLAGHFWPLVLLTIGFAPYFFYWLGSRSGRHVRPHAQQG